MNVVFQICLAGFLGLFPEAVLAQVVTTEDILCRDAQKPFFSVSCDKNGVCAAAPQREGSSARNFQIPKMAGVKRVFVLGESAAGILGSGGDIPGRFPGLEVINCGIGGYESYRIAGVFKEVLKYDPDLIIVLSGNNEGGDDYPCPGFSSAVRRLSARLLTKLYSWKHGPRAQIIASLKIHEHRLAAMAEEAGKRHIPIIFCTLPANISGMPPSGAPPLEKESFIAGMAAFEKKEFEKAAVQFGKNIKNDPNDLFSRFYLAKTQEALKRFDDAKESYLQVLDLDLHPDRTSRERNEMIVRVAGSGDAWLCDLEHAFYRVSKNGIPGFGQITDAVHWRSSFNGFVWTEIAKTAGDMGVSGFESVNAPSSPEALSDEEVRKAFSYAVTCLADIPEVKAGIFCEKALAEIGFMEAERPGLPEKLGMSEQAFSGFFIVNPWSRHIASRLVRLRPVFLAHLAEVQRRRGDLKKALSLSERAITLAPDMIWFRSVKALALSELGRKAEAEKELTTLYSEQALRAIPLGRVYGLLLPDRKISPADAALSKKTSDDGVGKISSGNFAAAEELLARAVKLNPSNAEAYLSLCFVQFSGKNFFDARESCSLAALSADSYYPAARQRLRADAAYAKAQILLETGDRSSAREELEKALKNPPPGWNNLEAVRSELKKLGKK